MKKSIKPLSNTELRKVTGGNGEEKWVKTVAADPNNGDA